jgi:hypothetical protein
LELGEPPKSPQTAPLLSVNSFNSIKEVLFRRLTGFGGFGGFGGFLAHRYSLYGRFLVATATAVIVKSRFEHFLSSGLMSWLQLNSCRSFLWSLVTAAAAIVCEAGRSATCNDAIIRNVAR